MKYKPRKPGDIRGGQSKYFTGEVMGGGGGARIKKLFGTKGSQTKAHKKPKSKTVGDYYELKGLNKGGFNTYKDIGIYPHKK